MRELTTPTVGYPHVPAAYVETLRFRFASRLWLTRKADILTSGASPPRFFGVFLDAAASQSLTDQIELIERAIPDSDRTRPGIGIGAYLD